MLVKKNGKNFGKKTILVTKVLAPRKSCTKSFWAEKIFWYKFIWPKKIVVKIILAKKMWVEIFLADFFCMNHLVKLK